MKSKHKLHLEFSPTRLKQIKKIALSGSRAKLKLLNGKIEEGFQLLKTTAKKLKSFTSDLADRIPQALAARISLDLFSHFEAKTSKKLGIPKGIVLGGVLALMAALPATGQVFINAPTTAALDAAIITANGNAADHVIRLEAGQVYTLVASLTTVANNGTLSVICTGTTNAIIDGANNYRPFTMTIGSDLTISKITIQNGSALQGGGIYNDQGSLTISNSIITSNQATGGGADGDGGGIYSRGTGSSASVFIQNSTISLNSASQDGGGIYNKTNSILSIFSSTITDNFSNTQGGGVFNGFATTTNISRSLISGNTSNNRGGGVYNRTDGIVNISSSTISGNSSIDGGGIFNGFNATLSILSSTISGNTATDDGGGIHNVTSGSLTVSNSDISGNTATDVGGGVFNGFTGATLAIFSSTISGNTATDDGGGIYNRSTGKVTISNSTISTNSAVDGAGIFSSFTASLKITSSTLSGNTATDDGGGIFAVTSSSVTISNSLISANTSVTDGAGLFTGFYATTIGIFSSTITNNISGDDGAGIYNTSTSSLMISNSIISSNTSGDDGGGILNRTNSPLTITSSTLSGNSALNGGGLFDREGGTLTISNSIVTNNQATGAGSDGRGAGVYSIGTASSVFLLENSTISLNSARTLGGGIFNRTFNQVIISQSTITQNFSDRGGAGVLNRTNSPLTITSSTITNNICNDDGGGIYNRGDSPLTISNTLISGNTSDFRGGGVYTGNDSPATITSSTIINNTASNDGGGVNNRVRSAMTISDTFISGNTSGDDGGGIHNDRDSPLTVSKSVISGNTADYYGGGIATGYDSSLTISSSSIINNSSDNHGGGIFHNNASLTIQASSIARNQSATKGGGIHIYDYDGGNTTLLTNTTISGNTATGDGGGVSLYNYDDSNGNSIMTMQHVTLSDNSGVGTGGFTNSFRGAASADITLQNTIIGNSTGAEVTLAGANLALVQTSIVEDGSVAGATAVDPFIGVLTLNSGFLIHPVFVSSPAVDAGTNIAFATDQVGNPRDATPHIGAVEVVAPDPCLPSVTITANAGAGSLRQAILDANADSRDCTIFLDQGTTYTISANLPTIASVAIGGKLSIISTGTTNAIIDAGGLARTITLSTASDLLLSNITIQNGSAPTGGAIYSNNSNVEIKSGVIRNNNATAGHGGGIFSVNSSTLIISSSSISGNTSTDRGGGIFDMNSNLSIQATSISANQSTNQGGAMMIYGNATGGRIITIENSTISGNQSTAAAGGAIYLDNVGGVNAITLRHVTISNNSGTVTGGFANTGASNITVQNTIIANSIGADFALGGGTLAVVVASVVEDGNMAGAIAGDPNLAAFDGTSHTLLAGSIAIDVASTADALPTDQLGLTRHIPHDIGALEFIVPCPIDVTSTADAGVGTLRQAIIDANLSIDDCVIYLDENTTYTISSNLPTIANVAVGGKLSIISTGTINATINGANLFRPLTLTTGSNLTLSKITITSGSAPSGGGIYNAYGNLTISNSIITKNKSTGAFFGTGGGGVFSKGTGASLLIQSSTISLNSSSASGGGVYNSYSSSLTISSSTISGNEGAGFGGGGIWNYAADLAIQASSITANQSSIRGGGLIVLGRFSVTGQTVTIQNTTISGNQSTNSGGGIFHDGAGYNTNTLTLQHVTISNNSGTITGGFENANVFGGGGTLTIQNTIIANNANAEFGNSGAGILALVTASIVEDGTMAGATAGDPALNVLSAGIHTLSTGSIAIDAGSIADALTNDQKGIVRDATPDIGASEFFIPLVACPIDVTSTADAGVGTLRQAIIDANANITDCVIYLDENTTYTISSNLPIVTGTDVGGTLSIISTGTLNAVINGAGLFRPLTMDINSNLTLSKITITSGSAPNGGAIYNYLGDLTISNSLISGNAATGGKGGGIYSRGDNTNPASASVFIQNSTISLNTAADIGGGIANMNQSLLTISSSTISGNSAAAQSGGGIYNDNAPSLSITSSTITGNSANSTGGGVHNAFSSNVSISNSLISGNSANSTGGGIYNFYSPNLSVSSSSISGNTSVRGAGIYINNSTPVTISASSITSNQSTNQGGGVMIRGAAAGGQTILLQNTTISGNSSTGNAGGGIFHNNNGIPVNNITLQHVTLSDNTGNAGVGTGDGFANTGTSSITLQNTILANSIGAGDDFALGGGTLTLVTSSIVEDGSMAGAASGDPLLGALTLSSGFLVHIPQAGSPAIDAAFAGVLPKDQLGILRDATPTIGAIEISGACMVVSAPAGVTNTWLGCTNSDWQTATNWSLGTVPTASDVVYVPNVAANDLIIDEVAVCAKILVQFGAKCIVNYNAGGQLRIKF